MKQILCSVATIALLIFVTNACAQQSVTASKKYITRDVKVTDFNAINLQGSPDVIYTQSNKAGLQIYGSDNIVELLETTIENGTLTVKFKKNTSIMNSGKLEIRVSSPRMNNVSIQGSGDITLANGIKGEDNLSLSIQGSGDIQGSSIECTNLSVAIQGSGDITVSNIKSTNVKAAIAGSGDIDLKGTADGASYSVTGSGNIDAAGLKAVTVKANVSGSGDIGCHASTTLKAYVSGSGEIGYTGNPQTTEFSKKGVHKL